VKIASQKEPETHSHNASQISCETQRESANTNRDNGKTTVRVQIGSEGK